jgi:hypothetical protein
MSKIFTRKRIPFLVTAVHILLLIGVIYIQPKPVVISPRKPVAVHTVTIPEKTNPPSESVVYPLPHPTPRAPPTPPPAPTPYSDPTPRAVPPQKKLSQAKTPSKGVNHDKLISLVQESLNTLNSPKGNPTKTQKATPIKSLASELLTFEAKYEEELISYLEALLSLPEKGEVKIKLTLKREGSVQSLEILKAASHKNREYIQTSLPSCSFPSFGTHFKGETTHTFTLNLLGK